MLYYVLAALVASAMIPSARAEVDIRQAILLTKTQREKLSRLVRADKDARKLWEALRAEADTLVDDTPRPIAVMHYEGMLDTHPDRIATEGSLKDMDKLVVLSQAWAASGQAKYGKKAVDYVVAWSGTFIPTGNPINENKLEAVLAAYYLLKDLIPSEERGEITAWMRRIAEREMESGKNIPAAAQNNWHSKRVKLVALIGHILNDPTFTTYAKRAFEGYVSVGLLPDGSSQDFVQRDALSYHQSGLKPLLIVALFLGAEGKALYHWSSPSGSSLKKSVDFVLPYAEGKKVHREWVNTKVALDRERGKAGIAYYKPGKPFDPVSAVELFELASVFDSSSRAGCGGAEEQTIVPFPFLEYCFERSTLGGERIRACDY